MGINIRDDGMWHSRTFAWSGIDWTPRTVGWRLSWVFVALAIAAVAAVPFDRFDPARQRAAEAPRRARRRWWRRGRTGDAPAEIPAADDASAATGARLTPLSADARGPGLGTMVRAEWKLLARGLRWWYAGPIAVAIAAFTAPLSGVRSIVLPLAWLWPVLLWSKLGTREATHQTEPVFFSAPRPLARQLSATWISGVMLAVLAAGPVAVRFVVAGEHAALLAWAVGAMFIPALALALGVWTRSGKFFEALYTALCYAVIQSATPLDFMGAIPAATARGNAAVFAVLTALLLAIALFGRRRRLRN
jgi:hypothetical protein